MLSIKRIVDIICHPLQELYFRQSRYSKEVDTLINFIVDNKLKSVSCTLYSNVYDIDGKPIIVWSADSNFPYAYGYIYYSYSDLDCDAPTFGPSIRTAYKLHKYLNEY